METTAPTGVRLPTIHLNGTSKQALLDQLADAYSALDEALAKMGQACPNGRDYYPQGPDAIGEALRQHERRLRVVRIIRDEYFALSAKVADL